MAEPKKITEEEAGRALQQLVEGQGEEEAPEQVPDEKEAKTTPEAEPGSEAEPEAAQGEATVEGGGEGEDDLESLKRRLQQAEAQRAEQEKLDQARWDALQRRHAESERILRDRYLRKSTVTDRAVGLLRRARTEEGIPLPEIDTLIHEIETTMNPASMSYSSPVAAEATEDQAIVLNRFLNEKGMTVDEADQFGNWIRSDGSKALTPSEQAVVNQSLDGFLRIAHGRYLDGIRDKEARAKTADTVNAVKSVQRTQREAARAASSLPTAPRKQPAGPKTGIDTKKLTRDDISNLLRLSVEENR